LGQSDLSGSPEHMKTDGNREKKESGQLADPR